LEMRIEDFVDPKGGKWMLGKNLLKEILRNSNICILENRKEMMLEAVESSRVSILDFITNVIRRAGPTEEETRSNSREFQLYRMYVDSLVRNLCPRILFKNKLLLTGGGKGRQQQMKKSERNLVGRRHSRKRKKSSGSGSSRRQKRRTGRSRDSSSDYYGDDESDEGDGGNGRRKSKRNTSRGSANAATGNPYLYSSSDY